jgi:acyl dehydratase
MQVNDTYTYEFLFTQQDVEKFAQLTGDTNPIHLDEGYTAQTPFKKPIIHGFLGSSIFSKVLGTLFPGEGSIYLSQTMDFKRPMFVNVTYEAIFKVKEIKAEKHQAIIQTTIRDKQTGKETVSGEAIIMNTQKI